MVQTNAVLLAGAPGFCAFFIPQKIVSQGAH